MPSALTYVADSGDAVAEVETALEYDVGRALLQESADLDVVHVPAFEFVGRGIPGVELEADLDPTPTRVGKGVLDEAAQVHGYALPAVGGIQQPAACARVGHERNERAEGLPVGRGRDQDLRVIEPGRQRARSAGNS